MKKKFDFESASDPITMDRIFEQRGREIDSEIALLKRAKDRYTNPEVPKQLEALEAEQAERQKVYDECQEALRKSWMGNGFKSFNEKLQADETKTDNEILSLLEQVKQKVNERTRILVLRDATTKKYGRWLVTEGRTAEGSFWRGVNPTVLDKKIHVVPAGGGGTSDAVLKIFLDRALEK